MSPTLLFKKRRQSESAKAKTQQRSKLKKTLLRKAAQYSLECESDVFVMIRIRKSGQRYIFNSSPSEQWLPSMPELNDYYPTPAKNTLEDILPRYDKYFVLDRQNDSAYGSSAEKDT
ncbi:hypothetical protein BDV59DRAFT_209012 [Aspergillus ambiguus]|uniref:uncharacterized protein n=1 Tax=Aspergillus ambiguus TaxID=176160 RepID=UPI003CCD34E0